MAVIKTTADVASKEFRANQAAMRALVAELEAQRAKAAEGGPPKPVNVIWRAENFCRASG